MKKTTFFSVFCFLIANVLHAQVISNEGNRAQTYPNVTQTNPNIVNFVNQVSIPSLEANIRWMQDLGRRRAESSKVLQTQNWLVDKFEALGLDVRIHHFPCKDPVLFNCGTLDTFEAGNIAAIQYGTEFPDEYIVVSSHYDHPDGPGADDNASGTAGVLEIARILSQHSFKRSIIYLPFNAEEYGLIGSFYFVEECAKSDMSILACFNLDMLGFFPEDEEELTMYSGSSYISDRLWKYYEHVANLYIPNIPTKKFTKGDSYGGDHMPFNIYEYPALYIGDVEYIDRHPCYHLPCDTIGAGVNNFNLVQGFTQATLAAVAELANGWLAPQRLSVVPADKKITISWDTAPQAVKYRLFRNNQFFKELTQTKYVDTNVVNGEKYVYYVTGIKEITGEESTESNRDSIMLSQPLILPYFNDFESSNVTEWRIDQDWVLSTTPYLGNYSYGSNTQNPKNGLENFLTISELCWFQIPEEVTNVYLSFYLSVYIRSLWKNANAFVEITKDRKRWDKLVKISQYSDWDHYVFSLNNYIGEPFVQLRIRIESSGTAINSQTNKKQFLIDDISINFQSIPLPKNVRITNYNDSLQNATIKWDAVNVPVRGYNIYRDSIKINSEFVTETKYYDTGMLETSCYQITAVYSGQESSFSNKACLNTIGIKTVSLSEFKIYPNPSSGILTIKTGLQTPYTITVFNATGLKVYQNPKFIDGQLDLSHLPKGFYFLNITNGKSSISKKIIIQ